MDSAWVIPTVIGIAAVVFGIAVTVLPGVVLWKVYKSWRGPQLKGPGLTGTAQVISRQRGFVVNYTDVVLKVWLRVQSPGREPYDVTFKQTFDRSVLDSVQPGSIVPVLIDSTNPQTVRIDLSLPSMPTGVGSSGIQVLDLRQGAPGDGTALANQLRPALAGRLQAGPAGVQFASTSSADLLVSGQRVPGVLKSFADTGNTPLSLGQVPSRPEFMDDPLYMFDVALQFPNLPPVDGQAVLRVPRGQVPNLAIGMQLVCAVDHADPSHRFVVDWDAIAH
jgi:hypothetical protein